MVLADVISKAIYHFYLASTNNNIKNYCSNKNNLISFK